MWAYAQRDGCRRNIGGAMAPCVENLKMRKSKSSVLPFLVSFCKVWLTHTARVLCSNAANIGERKIWTQSEFCTW